MEKDKGYQKLLDKMLRIESLGDIVYKSLISRTKDNNLRLAYERLALNERETAKYIEKELLALDKNHPISVNSVILNIAKIICGTLTASQIAWALKNILKGKMYSKWHNIYKDKNIDFWNLLLNHEKLQHELLSPFWDN